MVKATGTGAEQLSNMPTFRNRKELEGFVREKIGDDAFKRIREQRDVTERRRLLVEELHNSGLNGQSEKMAERLLLNQQELDRKEGFFSKLLKGVTAPFRWTWGVMKAHPVLSTLAVATLMIVGGYYFAGSIEKLASIVGIDKLKTFIDSSAPLGKLTHGTTPVDKFIQPAAETMSDMM